MGGPKIEKETHRQNELVSQMNQHMRRTTEANVIFAFLLHSTLSWLSIANQFRNRLRCEHIRYTFVRCVARMGFWCHPFSFQRAIVCHWKYTCKTARVLPKPQVHHFTHFRSMNHRLTFSFSQQIKSLLFALPLSRALYPSNPYSSPSYINSMYCVLGLHLNWLISWTNTGIYDVFVAYCLYLLRACSIFSRVHVSTEHVCDSIVFTF